MAVEPRLRQTRVWGGTGRRDVESLTLTHSFPDPGDTTRAGLWLTTIKHSALVGTAIPFPDIMFTGVQLANRGTAPRASR